nr:aspartokinase 2, chloroplastic isoform X1 [Ipomoea batatas]
MKFGGSSVASAERMREVADLILSFPEERPVIVLSAMGKTTNNLLLAGEKALSCGVSNVSEIEEFTSLKELHLRTIQELGLDVSIISEHLEKLDQLLNGIAMVKELTLRTKDKLVSFGERLSTRIFAAYLNKLGAKAQQGSHPQSTATCPREGIIPVRVRILIIKTPGTIITKKRYERGLIAQYGPEAKRNMARYV